MPPRRRELHPAAASKQPPQHSQREAVRGMMPPPHSDSQQLAHGGSESSSADATPLQILPAAAGVPLHAQPGGSGSSAGSSMPHSSSPADPSLVPTSALGTHQSVFTYPSFNRVQSACFERTYKSDESLLVSAPTGSGKTGIFELAICRLLASATLEGGRLESFSIIYFGASVALSA
jgi:ATP-dependent DNA helicase HFM1/MER3